jgi:hypothetical protein
MSFPADSLQLEHPGAVSSSLEIAPGTFYVAFVDFDPEIVFEYDYWENFESFTLRVFLPQCYTDFNYPGDLLTTLN